MFPVYTVYICVHQKKTYVHTKKARNCVVFALLCTLCTYLLRFLLTKYIDQFAIAECEVVSDPLKMAG